MEPVAAVTSTFPVITANKGNVQGNDLKLRS